MKTILLGSAAIALGLFSTVAPAQLGLGGSLGGAATGSIGSTAGSLGSLDNSLGTAGSLGSSTSIDPASGRSAATLGGSGSLGSSSSALGRTSNTTAAGSLNAGIVTRTPGSDSVKSKVSGAANAAGAVADESVDNVKTATRKTRKDVARAAEKGTSVRGKADVRSSADVRSPGDGS